MIRIGIVLGIEFIKIKKILFVFLMRRFICKSVNANVVIGGFRKRLFKFERFFGEMERVLRW